MFIYDCEQDPKLSDKFLALDLIDKERLDLSTICEQKMIVSSEDVDKS